VSRAISSVEQGFLLRLARLLVERRGFGMSFEVDGWHLRLCAHPPYAAPATVVVRVDGPCCAYSAESGNPVTVHDVAVTLTQRVRSGLG
jgi:hypothetical protein